MKILAIKDMSEEFYSVDVTLKEMFQKLTSFADKGPNISLIIAWLPLIKCIQVYEYVTCSWLDITFENDEVLQIYDVGIESDLAKIVREGKVE